MGGVGGMKIGLPPPSPSAVGGGGMGGGGMKIGLPPPSPLFGRVGGLSVGKMNEGIIEDMLDLNDGYWVEEAMLGTKDGD